MIPCAGVRNMWVLDGTGTSRLTPCYSCADPQYINLVINGDFEEAFTSASVYLTTVCFINTSSNHHGLPSLQGAPTQNYWTLLSSSNASPEIIGYMPTQAAVGKRFMHLHVNCQTSSGGVYQDIVTVVGQAYVLSFAASGGNWDGADDNDFGLNDLFSLISIVVLISGILNFGPIVNERFYTWKGDIQVSLFNLEKHVSFPLGWLSNGLGHFYLRGGRHCNNNALVLFC
jgi:hypothetical protein